MLVEFTGDTEHSTLTSKMVLDRTKGTAECTEVVVCPVAASPAIEISYVIGNRTFLGFGQYYYPIDITYENTSTSNITGVVTASNIQIGVPGGGGFGGGYTIPIPPFDINAAETVEKNGQIRSQSPAPLAGQQATIDVEVWARWQDGGEWKQSDRVVTNTTFLL